MDSIQSNEENLNPQDENYVPKKAYQDVTQDMHKYKGKTKELEAKLNEYQAKLDAIENEKLAEQGKWQELAQANAEKLNRLTQERDQERSKFLDFNKKQAVIADLGGLESDSYASFITVSNISVDEHGIPNREEVKAEADRFRSLHPKLIKTSVKGILSPDAPSVSGQGMSKDYSQMSPAERHSLRQNLIQNKQTK